MHTKTPYQVKLYGGDPAIITDSEGCLVAKFSYCPEAIAEEIVNCVNSHEVLVSTLMEIQRGGESGNVDMPPRLWGALDQALKAAGVTV